MILILSTLLTLGGGQSSTPIKLDAPKTITKSVRVARGSYTVPTPLPYDENKDASIRIQGDNIVVDFQGATLWGSSAKTDPDQRAGTGIYVSGRNVTILNAKVHGYKVLCGERAPGGRRSTSPSSCAEDGSS